MFTSGISVHISIIGLIVINLSGLIAGEKERFSDFYTAPGNLELIAMASDHSPHHRSSGSHDPDHNPHSRQSPRSDFRSKSSSPPRKSPIEEYSSDEPRFSIGLGTLAPSYSQKFGLDGRTRLDFDHRANGFSYTLTNNHHVPQQGQQGQQAYGDSSQDSKVILTVHPASQLMSNLVPISLVQTADGNVKIYYDQRFSPYAAAETNSFLTRIPFIPGNVGSYSLRPLQQQTRNSVLGKFADLFAKYAPKSNSERPRQYTEEAGPSGGPPRSPFYSPNYDEGRPSGGPMEGEYQGGLYNSRYNENGPRKQGPPPSEFSDSEGSLFDAHGDDGGPDGYSFPLPFHKKGGPSFSLKSNPDSSLDIFSRLGSDSSLNEYGSNSGPEPVVLGSMIDHYNGLDNTDAFSAYIAGLPLTP